MNLAYRTPSAVYGSYTELPKTRSRSLQHIPAFYGHAPYESRTPTHHRNTRFILQLSKNTEYVSLFRHIYPFIPPLDACSGPGRLHQTSSEGTFLSSIRNYPYRPIRISTGNNLGAFTSQVRQPFGILTMGGLWTPGISSTTKTVFRACFHAYGQLLPTSTSFIHFRACRS